MPVDVSVDVAELVTVDVPVVAVLVAVLVTVEVSVVVWVLHSNPVAAAPLVSASVSGEQSLAPFTKRKPPKSYLISSLLSDGMS